MYMRPDGGAVRHDTRSGGDPARSTGSLLWEVAALDRGRTKDRDCPRGSEEMREQIKQGEGSTGRTCIAICGMVSMFHEGACLANFLAIGEPRGAGAGEGAASLVGVFSLEGAGLAECEVRWPRPVLGGRRTRSDFDSQLTMVWSVGKGCSAEEKGKGDETVGSCSVSRNGSQWPANGRVRSR